MPSYADGMLENRSPSTLFTKCCLPVFLLLLLAPASSLAQIRADETPAACGTAFFVTQNGYLLTSFHVIEGARRILVVQNEASMPARIVAVDADDGLAVLKVEASAPTALALADPDTGSRRTPVMSIGFADSVTQGTPPNMACGELIARGGRSRSTRFSIAGLVAVAGSALVDELGNAIAICISPGRETNTATRDAGIVSARAARRLVETIPDLRERLPSPHKQKRDAAEIVVGTNNATARVLVWRDR